MPDPSPVPSSNDPAFFYDQALGQRLASMWYGNQRMEAALAFVCRKLPTGPATIVEIGCGIGWAAEEFLRARPGSRVLGFDLSAAQVAAGHRLFPHEGIQLVAGSFPTALQEDLSGSVDAIVMIDVYEHIPPEDRAGLHAAIRSLLKPDGSVLFACPTPRFQAFLRSEHPSEIQPVDEDITDEILQQFAAAVGGRVACKVSQNIWRPDDYFHAQITRSPDQRAEPEPAVAARLGTEERQQLIETRLGVQPSRTGMLLPRTAGAPSLLVVAPQDDEFSETFIQQQIERLPFRTDVLLGLPWPNRWLGGRSIVPFWIRVLVRVLSRVLAPLVAGDRDRAYTALMNRIPAFVRQWIIARAFRRRGVERVLAQYGPTGGAVVGACSVTGATLTVHFHGFDAHGTANVERNRPAYRELARHKASIIAVSEPMKRALIDIGLDPARIHVIPCGVDPDRLPTADPAHAGPIVLAVGRFVEKKAPDLTIRAFASALKTCPDARLVMIGDGPLLRDCQALVTSLGIGTHVEFPGSVPNWQVLPRLKTARMFVQHSRRAKNGDSEGSPVAIAEAAMAGLPVVSTRHAGIPEIVQDGRTGYLVDEGDVSGMAARIGDLLADPGLAADMGRAARQHTISRYSLANQLSRLADVLLGTAPVAAGSTPEDQSG